MRLSAFFTLFLTFFSSHALTLTVGTPDYNPPFIMSSGQNHPIGFDAQIMFEICHRMNATCNFQSMTYSQLFIAVKNYQIDLAIGALTISLSRDIEYIFSLPYLQSYGQYVVRNSSNIHSIAELPGKTFGIENDDVYGTLIRTNFGSTSKIKTYNLHTQLLEALVNGAVDVLLLDKATADYWVQNSANNYRLLGNPMQYGYGYGIMSAKGEDALISKINEALISMQKDGTYLKIFSTYFTEITPNSEG